MALKIPIFPYDIHQKIKDVVWKTHFFFFIVFLFLPKYVSFFTHQIQSLINSTKFKLQIYTDSKLLSFVKLQRDTIEQVKSKAITHSRW